jgi:hypothetical protein
MLTNPDDTPITTDPANPLPALPEAGDHSVEALMALVAWHGGIGHAIAALCCSLGGDADVLYAAEEEGGRDAGHRLVAQLDRIADATPSRPEADPAYVASIRAAIRRHGYA